jgi:phosphoribosylformylglycinamidine synthase I
VRSGSQMKIGLIRFPGSNCDQDCVRALNDHFGIVAKPIWHTESILPKIDGVVIPGGFSYGDYLRCGGLAALSPIVAEIKKFAARGGPVIGICNGFQILTESHILPGALLPNMNGKFVCKPIDLSNSAPPSFWGTNANKAVLRMPIAHGEGRFLADQETLKRLAKEGRVAFTYANEDPNGSSERIAGILSENHRVLGMMPHPERAMDENFGGSSDGKIIWKAFLNLCT